MIIIFRVKSHFKRQKEPLGEPSEIVQLGRAPTDKLEKSQKLAIP